MRACQVVPLLLAAACAARDQSPTPLEPGTVFLATAPPLAQQLEVGVRELEAGEAGAPRALSLYAPAPPGTYPVVVFQHGFVSDPRSYSEVLRHLASHGFVVVAPQMYAPDAVPLGKPATQVEARDAAEVIAWAAKYAPTVAGSAADPRGIGLAGHSRGGKVAWLVAAAGGSPVRALAGVDPVDGTGGPLFSAQPEALPAAATGLPPSSIIGMERGGACAPEGDNYRHFFERTTPPTRLALVLGHGHTDMLDPSWSGGGICFEGPARAQVRTLTGALLAAFFRQQLQGDETVAPFLESGTLEPLEVTHETR